ncbi:3-dehydroquinate synthase [Clostridium sp. DL1XJH146]
MKKLTVKVTKKEYPIIIDRGNIEKIGLLTKEYFDGDKVAIITDENVDKYYGEIVEDSLIQQGYGVIRIIIKPGEKSKSFESLNKIYEELLDFEITRGDLIITLGGGVIGDLGGFAASTFLRGVPFIQVPTSLLAQIDSSVGGKVAIDLERGKNLVGSFYHPEAVFIDPNVLNTLEDRFLYDGTAEAIKYGCIRSEILFTKLEEIQNKQEYLNSMDEIIYECCKIKKEVVQNDERDLGERMILNFGHTFGHAVEKYFGYEKYTHGEGVAIGMYTITKKSEESGFTKKGTLERMKRLIQKYNLPFWVEELKVDMAMSTIFNDKKAKGSKLRIILLKDIGNVVIKEIDKEEVEKYF